MEATLNHLILNKQITKLEDLLKENEVGELKETKAGKKYLKITKKEK